MRRGDVVLVHFPFSSGTGGKLHPALVVQNDANNARLQNTIVAMITSSTKSAGVEPTHCSSIPRQPLVSRRDCCTRPRSNARISLRWKSVSCCAR